MAAAKLERARAHSGFDARGLTAAAVGLLGLGPGLTPSGDDFVGGLLIALRELGLSSLADRIGERVVFESAERTNTISAAHLRWAARGQGSEALHDTFRALRGHSEGDLDESLTTLAGVGHCSGWDALAGIVLGSVVWMDRVQRRLLC